MIAISLTIEGVPKPKGRPRFARRGNFVSTYTDKKTKDYESIVADCGKEYMRINDLDALGYAIAVRIDAYMPIPASATKKARNAMLNGELQHIKKPDIDNLAKLVCDGLNGVTWIDDSQIVRLIVTKQYSDLPRVVVTITECVK